MNDLKQPHTQGVDFYGVRMRQYYIRPQGSHLLSKNGVSLSACSLATSERPEAIKSENRKIGASQLSIRTTITVLIIYSEE